VKTSPKRSYLVIESERFGLVFAKTVSIISGTDPNRQEWLLCLDTFLGGGQTFGAPGYTFGWEGEATSAAGKTVDAPGYTFRERASFWWAWIHFWGIGETTFGGRQDFCCAWIHFRGACKTFGAPRYAFRGASKSFGIPGCTFGWALGRRDYFEGKQDFWWA
jgi:hypothetical protein